MVLIRNICISVWSIAGLMVVLATGLPLIRANDWWIRWFDFPRLQIFILGIALIALQFFLRWRVPRLQAFVLVLLLLSVGYQAYRIFPYTRLAAVQVKGAVEDEGGVIIRLVTANVLMHNRNAARYLQVLRAADPDIILTTETDQWWLDQLKALDSSYPYQVKFPLENTYGMILHSRLALIEPSVEFLIEPMVPSIFSGVRLPGGQIFQLIGLHPRPPGPTENEDTTERDAELIVTAKFVERTNLPVVVLGDLNDVAWSHTTALFQKISGLLDPRIGRGTFNTFHADHFFIRFPLDHIFHSAHFKFLDMRRLPHIGSDHFALYTALLFHPRKDTSKPPAEPTPGEREEADETLEKAF